jgi:hypothetical protein
MTWLGDLIMGKRRPGAPPVEVVLSQLPRESFRIKLEGGSPGGGDNTSVLAAIAKLSEKIDALGSGAEDAAAVERLRLKLKASNDALQAVVDANSGLDQ